ncbi:MAG: hypothetical protein EXS36_08225 [Pedosphaera sp.]|nr:hypothetical protein [Pedosphaera sp.]
MAQTASVEYFANDQPLGKGAGANFRLPWSKVAGGSYSIVAVGTQKGSGGATDESLPVLVYILPASNTPIFPGFTSVVLEGGKLHLSMLAMEGEQCMGEVAEDLETGSWRTLEQMVGDGQVQTMQIDAGAAAKFFRIRMAR